MSKFTSVWYGSARFTEYNHYAISLNLEGHCFGSFPARPPPALPTSLWCILWSLLCLRADPSPAPGPGSPSQRGWPCRSGQGIFSFGLGLSSRWANHHHREPVLSPKCPLFFISLPTVLCFLFVPFSPQIWMDDGRYSKENELQLSFMEYSRT